MNGIPYLNIPEQKKKTSYDFFDSVDSYVDSLTTGKHIQDHHDHPGRRWSRVWQPRGVVDRKAGCSAWKQNSRQPISVAFLYKQWTFNHMVPWQPWDAFLFSSRSWSPTVTWLENWPKRWAWRRPVSPCFTSGYPVTKHQRRTPFCEKGLLTPLNLLELCHMKLAIFLTCLKHILKLHIAPIASEGHIPPADDIETWRKRNPLAALGRAGGWAPRPLERSRDSEFGLVTNELSQKLCSNVVIKKKPTPPSINWPLSFMLIILG